MKNLLIALALAAPLTFASVGNAAPSKSSKTTTTDPASSKCARAKAQGKACNIIFGVHNIKGDRAASTGTDIMAKLETRFGGLIRLRLNFNDKILKAAEGL